MIDTAIRHFLQRFEEIESKRHLRNRKRRIGSELKFPLVRMDGQATGPGVTDALWEFLVEKGWDPLRDAYSGKTVGATRQGEMNEDRAACETGFCKVEFSLAHTDTLHRLNERIGEMKALMHEFGSRHGVAFLGFGIHPVTPPGKDLLMGKSRNLFWDRLFGGNEHISPENGTDVHLFTISASSQVHIDVTVDEAVDAVNVFNGIAGAQVAMTANSNIWKGRIADGYKCLGEMFWDWWLKERNQGRYGVPERKFKSLEDYFRAVLEFTPVYVRRNGMPVGLPHCRAFADFYVCPDGGSRCARGDSVLGKCGLTPEGDAISVEKQLADLDQHFTFFWHNARLSRYYTLENRINDQQPPEEMMTIPALTLGIMENLGDAVDLIDHYPWEFLQEARIEAARSGLDAITQGVPLRDLSERLLGISQKGLKTRGLGEERYLDPLWKRIKEKTCPADRAADIFEAEGAGGLVKRMRISC
jgi:gamma-glutamylcysteine synthetase